MPEGFAKRQTVRFGCGLVPLLFREGFCMVYGKNPLLIEKGSNKCTIFFLLIHHPLSTIHVHRFFSTFLIRFKVVLKMYSKKLEMKYVLVNSSAFVYDHEDLNKLTVVEEAKIESRNHFCFENSA